jgi:hypothetical protein
MGIHITKNDEKGNYDSQGALNSHKSWETGGRIVAYSAREI